MITSTSNEKVKRVRALQSRAKNRREAGLFVIEGVRLAEEALQAGVKPKFVLFSDNLNERGRELLDKMDENSSDIEEVAEHVLQSVSDSPSPQGILLVLPIVEPVLPQQLDLVIIVDQIRDPGNMGTILRSAAAAGVQAVLCTPDSVDLYSPKVLRGGMGSHFKLAVHSLAWDDIETICKNHSMEVYLAAADRGAAYTETDFSTATAIIVGGEAEGASPHAYIFAQQLISIPMPGGSESLNAAMAATLLMFEVVRQRSKPKT